MVIVPGLAVGLLALLGVLVALGLLASVRAWLRPLLIGLASVLGRVPIVGGFLRHAVLGFERTVIGWLASAAEHAERFATGWFRGLETLLAGLGAQIAGLALDVYHSASRLVRVKVPALLRALRTDLLRLVRAAERRVLAIERRVFALARATAARIAAAERRIQASLVRRLDEARAFVLRELRSAVGGLRAALHVAERAIAAAEFRIGRAEQQLFGVVGPELRRLAHDLRPDVVAGWVLNEARRLIPHDVVLFFDWVWSWLRGGSEFLVALISGEWPGPVTHRTMIGHLEAIARDAPDFARSLYDEHKSG